MAIAVMSALHVGELKVDRSGYVTASARYLPMLGLDRFPAFRATCRLNPRR